MFKLLKFWKRPSNIMILNSYRTFTGVNNKKNVPDIEKNTQNLEKSENLQKNIKKPNQSIKEKEEYITKIQSRDRERQLTRGLSYIYDRLEVKLKNKIKNTQKWIELFDGRSKIIPDINRSLKNTPASSYNDFYNDFIPNFNEKQLFFIIKNSIVNDTDPELLNDFLKYMYKSQINFNSKINLMMFLEITYLINDKNKPKLILLLEKAKDSLRIHFSNLTFEEKIFANMCLLKFNIADPYLLGLIVNNENDIIQNLDSFYEISYFKIQSKSIFNLIIIFEGYIRSQESLNQEYLDKKLYEIIEIIFRNLEAKIENEEVTINEINEIFSSLSKINSALKTNSLNLLILKSIQSILGKKKCLNEEFVLDFIIISQLLSKFSNNLEENIQNLFVDCYHQASFLISNHFYKENFETLSETNSFGREDNLKRKFEFYEVIVNNLAEILINQNMSNKEVIKMFIIVTKYRINYNYNDELFLTMKKVHSLDLKSFLGKNQKIEKKYSYYYEKIKDFTYNLSYYTGLIRSYFDYASKTILSFDQRILIKKKSSNLDVSSMMNNLYSQLERIKTTPNEVDYDLHFIDIDYIANDTNNHRLHVLGKSKGIVRFFKNFNNPLTKSLSFDIYMEQSIEILNLFMKSLLYQINHNLVSQAILNNFIEMIAYFSRNRIYDYFQKFILMNKEFLGDLTIIISFILKPQFYIEKDIDAETSKLNSDQETQLPNTSKLKEIDELLRKISYSQHEKIDPSFAELFSKSNEILESSHIENSFEKANIFYEKNDNLNEILEKKRNYSVLKIVHDIHKISSTINEVISKNQDSILEEFKKNYYSRDKKTELLIDNTGSQYIFQDFKNLSSLNQDEIINSKCFLEFLEEYLNFQPKAIVSDEIKEKSIAKISQFPYVIDYIQYDQDSEDMKQNILISIEERKHQIKSNLKTRFIRAQNENVKVNII